MCRSRLPVAQRTRRRRLSLPALCDAVDAMAGVWIAAEYRPSKGTAQGLAWLAALKSRGQPIGA